MSSSIPTRSPANRPVRHVDVVSTVLEALDLPAREGDEGRPLMAGSAPPVPDGLRRPGDIYAEGMFGPERRALIRDDLKTVCALEDDGTVSPKGDAGHYRCWLHDLAEDPLEREALTEHPRLVELTAELSRYYLSSEKAERLSALGYVMDPDAAP